MVDFGRFGFCFARRRNAADDRAIFVTLMKVRDEVRLADTNVAATRADRKHKKGI
jgi:hypothetical protein